MKKEFRTLWALGALAIVVIAGLFWRANYRKEHRPLPYYKVEVQLNKIVETSEPGNKVGYFAFVDQNNEKFSRENLEGKVFVVDYFFAQCPGICKVMTTELSRVYERYHEEERFRIISCTSKPEEDSVPALMSYARSHGITDQNAWKFLTGNKKDLYRVARNEFLIVNDTGDGGDDDFIHTEQLVLCDQEGYIRGYYDGTDSMDVNRLMADISVLLNQ